MKPTSRQQCRLIRGATVVSVQVREAARYLLSELDGMKLEVCKTRGRGGEGYVRVVVTPNPHWYSRLCQQYLAPRHNRRWKRPRTQIRRSNVRRTLVALSQGWRRPGLEFDRVLAILEWWREQNDFEDATGLDSTGEGVQ